MKGRVFDEAALVMSDRDNVATAIDDLDEEREFDVDGTTVCLTDLIPFGHKFALVPLAPGDEVHKYGEVIGRATTAVEPGEWVHTHNCESTRGRGDLAAAEGGTDA
ncbi:UxaA family hydrolase [Halegenticoccus tardaugens]|uniref:UxaA family hydrolase n=1 Tax=Halegenticoccus tardaugens TaxID=2071624 RepID=UPI00100A34AD|nr:UxaA family hydrolase [Halegenticoccus tardaugens]